MKWMLKNSKGDRDAMLTFATVAYFVCMVKFIGHNLTINVDSFSINFGSLDSSLVASVLGPTLGAYVTRRYTTDKFKGEASEE